MWERGRRGPGYNVRKGVGEAMGSNVGKGVREATGATVRQEVDEAMGFNVGKAVAEAMAPLWGRRLERPWLQCGGRSEEVGETMCSNVGKKVEKATETLQCSSDKGRRDNEESKGIDDGIQRKRRR